MVAVQLGESCVGIGICVRVGGVVYSLLTVILSGQIIGWISKGKME